MQSLCCVRPKQLIAHELARYCALRLQLLGTCATTKSAQAACELEQHGLAAIRSHLP